MGRSNRNVEEKEMVREETWRETAKTKGRLQGILKHSIVETFYNIYIYEGNLNEVAK